MTLVNWSPFREFEDLFNHYGRLPASRRTTDDARDGTLAVQWRPVANISETNSAYLIKAELPEVAKEDVEVAVHDGVITVKGERRLEQVEESEQQHRVESCYGSFSRSFSLPADANEDAITAESKDGLLTVRIPKTELQQPKAINIQVD